MDQVQPQPKRSGRRPGRPAGGSDGAATRARVVDAAIELFGSQGFHATGVAELARTVGLGAGALYYHIGSKEELLWLVLERHVRLSLSRAEEVAASDLSPEAKLRELVRGHVEIISRHRREVAIYLRDADALRGDRATELQSLRGQVQSVWQRVITEGHRLGDFRTDDQITVNGILGMVNMVYLWYEPGRGYSATEVAERFSDLVIGGLTTRSPAETAAENTL